MKKISITSFVLPQELDELERTLITLNRASKYIQGKNYEFHIFFSVSDYLFDWNKSALGKQFFLDKFNSLKKLTEWADKSTFYVRDDVLGSLSAKRISHIENPAITHFIWLDSDICFDDSVLYYIDSAVDAIDNENNNSLYIITPEIVRYWDTTWDCLVNFSFLNKPLNYCKTNNPFIDCGVAGDVKLVHVQNNVVGQPRVKFGAGWFTLITKRLLDRIPIPESMGHYGFGDDTFMMWAIEKINRNGEQIKQYKLENYVVCENFLYRNNTHYNQLLVSTNRKKEFTDIAHAAFNDELNKLR